MRWAWIPSQPDFNQKYQIPIAMEAHQHSDLHRPVSVEVSFLKWPSRTTGNRSEESECALFQSFVAGNGPAESHLWSA
jgi:hypothetical protein